MSVMTILYIIIIWIGLNAIVPLIINSIERLYQPQIDALVKGLVTVMKWAAIRLLQGFLIVFCLPTIGLVLLFERIYPKVFENRYAADTRYGMRLLFTKDWWNEIIGGIRKYREMKKVT